MHRSVTGAAMPLYAVSGRVCWLAAVLTAAVGAAAADLAAPKHDSQPLTILEPNYPRAFFFRASESPSGNSRIIFADWNASFSRLMGIEGKTLDEEVPGRSSRNIDFFTRFKKLHPEQLVMLHYNGDARDPRYQTDNFFAGHWLYYNGSKLLADLPAEDGESVIRVADPNLFQVGMGRYKTSNEDVGLCALDAAGRPDWSRCEQVQIVTLDRRSQTLRVRRGCYGTKPQAWTAGNTYAAAHVTEGPWGKKSNLLWLYNYSTRGPRDRQGRCCADVLADDLAARFLPGGELAAFDGLEFDVLNNAIHIRGPRREADCDADGRGDQGVIDGINTYGIGVIQFCRLLRSKLGDDRLILADGGGADNQRAFGILNGIESEGWPVLTDWEIRDWSGGLNRHGYWSQHGRPPVFNYINHKFVTRGATPGSVNTPDVPLHVHRLVFAVATFTDSALCYCLLPPKSSDEMIGIWDELQAGTQRRPAWLGKPLGPAVHLAARQPDLLDGQGVSPNQAWLRRFQGQGIAAALDGNAIRLAAADPKAAQMKVRINRIPCNGPDLWITMHLRATPRGNYPPEMARLAWLGIAGPAGQLIDPDEMPACGQCVRGQQETPLDGQSGALVRGPSTVSCGNAAHSAYLVHPPYRQGVGYAYWQRDVSVPADARLEFFTGMSEKAPQRSDGVTFRVLVAEKSAEGVGPFKSIFEHSQKANAWIAHQVPLAPWAGKTVRLKFISDCGPAGNATTDLSYWGDAQVVSGPARPHSAPVRHMTWAGKDDFTATFYFSDIRSPDVDLEFSIEGGEPVWIGPTAVHAAADAMFREFEHGVVLANPGPRPYTFDLARLCPRGKFRRLSGSADQDPATNNGQAAGAKVTLGERDGLFLIRE